MSTEAQRWTCHKCGRILETPAASLLPLIRAHLYWCMRKKNDYDAAR